MKIKIVADSCCDTNEEINKEANIFKVPLTIYIDEKELKDDEQLDTKVLLEMMKNSVHSPRTASPSPNDFINQYQGEESVFVVTLSSQLSSSYSNAVLAKNMVQEDTKKFIHIFDSLSASIAQTLISLKVFELGKYGSSEIEIVERVTEYIKEMKTVFILESLDNLIKAGRMSKLMGKLSSVLSIKLIMGAADDGTIKLIEKVPGAKRAFKRLVEIIGELGVKQEEKILGISHCNCVEKAEALKREVLRRFKFKDVIIVETAGISTVYANDGGIIVSF